MRASTSAPLPSALRSASVLGPPCASILALTSLLRSAVNAARLQNRLAALSRFGGLPGGGVTRFCWGPAHEEARGWLLGEMKTAGLQTWVDPAGNVFGALGAGSFSASTPAVVTGSHIDTVRTGGRFDGIVDGGGAGQGAPSRRPSLRGSMGGRARR